MRQFRILLITITAIAFGCNDRGLHRNSSLIQGTWKLQKFINKEPECAGVTMDIVNVLKYRQDGTYTHHHENDSILGTYRIDQNKLIYEVAKAENELIENKDFLWVQKLTSDTLSLEIRTVCGNLYAIYTKE